MTSEQLLWVALIATFGVLGAACRWIWWARPHIDRCWRDHLPWEDRYRADAEGEVVP